MADVFRFPDPPKAPPPKNVLRATFFAVTGVGGRTLTCAAYDIETGLEFRLSYAADDVPRTELFRCADADERCAATPDQWRQLLVQKGFREIEADGDGR